MQLYKFGPYRVKTYNIFRKVSDQSEVQRL